MRRRLPPVPVPEPVPDNLPECLRWCIVEDWVQPGERIEHPDIRAWRRWQDARAVWAAEQGISVMEVPGGGRPRWRSTPWSP